MAQKKIQVRFCDTCVREVRATTTVRFGYAGTDYEIDVCEKHANALQRDFMGWANVATEVEKPSAFMRPDLVREHTRRPVKTVTHTEVKSPSPAVDAGSVAAPKPLGTNGFNVPAAAKNWTLTDHAKQQLAERGPKYGFTLEDVYRCATEPETTVQGATSESGRWQYFRGNVQLIVSPASRVVVTVLPRSTRDFAPEDQKPRPATNPFNPKEFARAI